MKPLYELWGRSAALVDEPFVLGESFLPCRRVKFSFKAALSHLGLLEELSRPWATQRSLAAAGMDNCSPQKHLLSSCGARGLASAGAAQRSLSVCRLLYFNTPITHFRTAFD